jgi:hypothetical protein
MQLRRSNALQAGGRWFEPGTAHSPKACLIAAIANLIATPADPLLGRLNRHWPFIGQITPGAASLSRVSRCGPVPAVWRGSQHAAFKNKLIAALVSDRFIYGRAMGRLAGKRTWLAILAFLGALAVSLAGTTAQAFPRLGMAFALPMRPLDLRSALPSAPLPPGAFTIKGSNGYSLLVLGVEAHRGRSAKVGIFVTGPNGGAIYSAPATVSETSIQANLGALGEIAVTFHPSGQERKVRPSCGGKPISFDSGYYEGTVAFHGEEGYTSVDTTKASGNLGFLTDILCPGISGERGGPSLPGAELNAYADGSRSGPHLKVVKNRPAARAHFEAGVSEVHEGISITRFTGAIEPAETFVFDPKMQTATLRPSAPFSGTARFRRTAKLANRWSGNLTVDLPGRSAVRLTGGGDRATLAHAHWDWHTGASSGSQ